MIIQILNKYKYLFFLFTYYFLASEKKPWALHMLSYMYLYYLSSKEKEFGYLAKGYKWTWQDRGTEYISFNSQVGPY